MELIGVSSGGILGNLDHRGPKQRLGEVIGAGPLAIDRSIIIVVGVIQGRTVRVLENLAGLQVGQVVGIANSCSGACSGRYAILQPRKHSSIRRRQSDGVGRRSGIIGSGQHNSVGPGCGRRIGQNRSGQRLSHIIDGRRVGQRITVSIDKHIGQIQRPLGANCNICSGNGIRRNRGSGVACIAKGEEVNRSIIVAAVILRSESSTAAVRIQHEVLLNCAVLALHCVAQRDRNSDLIVALGVGYLQTAASPLRKIGIIAGYLTGSRVGLQGNTLVGSFYIGRPHRHCDVIVGYVLEGGVTCKGYGILRGDGRCSCGLIIRTIRNNAHQTRIARFRCKDRRRQHGQSQYDRKQHRKEFLRCLLHFLTPFLKFFIIKPLGIITAMEYGPPLYI